MKRFNDKPICFSSVLSEEFLHDVPLRLTSLHINGITINDIMYFENSSIKSTNKKILQTPLFAMYVVRSMDLYNIRFKMEQSFQELILVDIHWI